MQDLPFTAKPQRTRTAKAGQNPVWDETFELQVMKQATFVCLVVAGCGSGDNGAEVGGFACSWGLVVLGWNAHCEEAE